ncbi:hypothetical protein ASPZODRAFT_131290 [Penicilliopsis zonata CBS 506.65]|uniref:Amine oxidase n=1 Tax=Penicilliopsis zonata CBS 506.65 TaxID=1073090 RepID=A0A1L9SKU8_9EURO|nr:hypothetical protein ASPZODRAFT_131290 [Penicilliopsis zonata CBS 506.65]OJJ47733.1 hypothetical protein ASPZODRAFT_131290 [Penicilliopsis zonata CBS 506.65]
MTRLVETVDLSNTSTAYFAPATVTQANGGLIHISGQPGSTKDGHVPVDYESQIHLALFNLRKVIIAAGASVRDIIKLTLFVVDYDPAQRKHTRHVEKFLAGHRPAVTLVPVSQLAGAGWLFEVDAVVARPEEKAMLESPRTQGAQEKPVDVVIIGAGLAGLTAAHDILRAGLSCVVLEARDRVGGKTWSQPLSGDQGFVEVGAAWINDTNQTKMYALAKRFGAEFIEQNTTGNCVLQDKKGAFVQFPYGQPPTFDDPAMVQDLVRIWEMCEADCQALDIARPKSTHLDSMTFEAYLRSRGASETSLATASIWTRAMLGQEPSEVSALYFLSYCRSGGGLLQMRSDRKGGGQHLRIRQGTQLFARGLADALPVGTIRLSSPVDAIEQVAGTRTAHVHANGALFVARKVISTVPSPVLKSISFTPSLPPAKRAWIESASYGYYTKAMMVFRTPFWIPKGFCGLTQSFVGPAAVIRDTSSPTDDKHILTCFMAGDHGRQWSALPTPAREQALLTQIGQLFGVKDSVAHEFVEMITYEWINDEYSGWGCPCIALPPGVMDTLGADTPRESFGHLHFAGTETAVEWKGYMEGAVQSGERAAGEVIKRLQGGVVAHL